MLFRSLSLRNVVVKFNVRGRILTAIRNVSLDIYEHESIAIVGESGSGKSVLTKTFAGMLDSNGFIPEGSIIFSDDEISKTDVRLNDANRKLLAQAEDMVNRTSKLARGASYYSQIIEKQNQIKYAQGLSLDEETDFAQRRKEYEDDAIDARNYLWTLDKNADANEYSKTNAKIKDLEAKLKALEKEKKDLLKNRSDSYKHDPSKAQADKAELERLKAAREDVIKQDDVAGNPYGLPDAILERNKIIAYEIVLSFSRYPKKMQKKFMKNLEEAFTEANSLGMDLNNPEVLNRLFDTSSFRVEYRSYDPATEILHGYAIIDCAKVKFTEDWQQIRGARIATVFQDPMTSLNPVITIGQQIMTVILKHQKCSNAEARERTIDIMRKVGIPDPESRFDDYPFEYSGGMRQRIVISIALSCQPKILICDEPTTALDVTIQAQIIRLIKDLQKELGFTTVFITHDLGVVANIAERVAVLYGGQIIELGTVEDVF